MKLQGWNISDIDVLQGREALRVRFRRTLGLWTLAFLAVAGLFVVGVGVAEAAPIARIAAGAPGFGLSAVLAGMVGGAGGLTALLWRRILAPGGIRMSRRVN
jgi:hypothetical protein